jgi:hypothetical protein
MNSEIIAALITGLFGALVTPFVTLVLVPMLKKSPKSEASEGTSRKPSPSSQPGKIALLAGLGGVCGIVLGYFLISPFFASPCPPFTPTSVHITSPVDGSNVSQMVTVQGTTCHIPEEEEVWLLVLPEGVTAYYPQAGPVVITSGGDWSVSGYIGIDSPADSGRSFTLIAAIADSQGSTAIHSYFSQSGPDYTGLDPLPQGIQLMSQIRVIRK